MLVGRWGADAPTGRAHDEAQLHQVGLVYVLDGHCVLACGGGQRVQSHGAAAELVHHRGQHVAVGAVKAQLVHVQHVQRIAGPPHR